MAIVPDRWTDEEIHTYTFGLTVASAAAGCALGVLFGRGMGRKSASLAALALLGAAAIVAGPSLTGYASRAVNRPSTERGSRRRLEGIRSAGEPEAGDIYSIDEALDEDELAA